MDARTISEALGGRPCGNGYIMRCPAHDDKNPSLSVKDGDKGYLLVHCHAGCTFESVRNRLQDMGLWPKSHRTATKKKQYERKKSRIQLLNLLDTEFIVYWQYLNARLEDHHRSRNKHYLDLHPEFRPMPAEPWEREITSSKRIRRIMDDLYD